MRRWGGITLLLLIPLLQCEPPGQVAQKSGEFVLGSGGVEFARLYLQDGHVDVLHRFDSQENAFSYAVYDWTRKKYYASYEATDTLVEMDARQGTISPLASGPITGIELACDASAIYFSKKGCVYEWDIENREATLISPRDMDCWIVGYDGGQSLLDSSCSASVGIGQSLDGG